MLIRKKNKGYVEIAGGKVDITDPCYEKGTWCQLTDAKIKPGTYRCRYYTGAELEQKDIDATIAIAKEYGKDPDRAVEMEKQDILGRCFVIELQVKGRAFQLNSPKWKEIGTIGVDAGLAGFFWNKPDFTDEQWDDFCDSMDDNQSTYLDKNMGFWCSSGYGDGNYGVYAIKEDNEIIALKICF